MQVRCNHCGTPFNLGKDTLMAALETVKEQDLKYTDIRCPKCRKSVRIQREALEKEVAATG